MATHIRYIRSAKDDLGKVRHLNDLCVLLGADALRLSIMAKHPRYKIFKIRKSDGSFRAIEDPEPKLKSVLRALNDMFQAVYYFQRPDCVFGFTISAHNDEPRNIISNARSHAGKDYMLNIDLKDFFHQIRRDRVERLMKTIFNKSCDDEVLQICTALVLYKDRLPMGSPTSPVLSNFAMMGVDHELIGLCKSFGIKYTRYADDLTFSGDQIFPPSFKRMVDDCLQHHGFMINPSKVRWYDKDDDKIVTGIIVGEDVLNLPATYFDKLAKEVELYKNTIVTDMLYQTGMSPRKLDLFRQELVGKINFAKMVCPGLVSLKDIEKTFLEDVPIDEISRSWLDLPYSF